MTGIKPMPNTNYPFISHPNVKSNIGYGFDRLTDAYMDTAERFAQLSSCRFLKMGAIIVKDDSIISIGYNETPQGFDNCCDDTVCVNDTDEAKIKNKKKLVEYSDSVAFKNIDPSTYIHAETIAISKGNNVEGSVLYCTHAPCVECAKQIYSAGIERVIYKHDISDDGGIIFLKTCGLYTIRFG